MQLLIHTYTTGNSLSKILITRLALAIIAMSGFVDLGSVAL